MASNNGGPWGGGGSGGNRGNGSGGGNGGDNGGDDRRPGNSPQIPEIEDIVKEVKKKNYSMRELIKAIVLSEAFHSK